jgi:hypothetical protein
MDKEEFDTKCKKLYNEDVIPNVADWGTAHFYL